MCFVCQALSLNTSLNGIHDLGTATPFAEATGSTDGSGSLASSASGAYQQAATGNQNIDGVLSGYKWTTTALTWRIPTSASQYDTNPNLSGIQYGDTTRTSTFLAPTAAMTTAVSTILDTLFGAVSGLSFTQAAASDTSADMSIGRSTATASFGTAYAYYPTGSGTGLSGDSWFSDAYDSWGGGYAYDNPVKGGYAWTTYIHEFGHNMGLKHGQETGGPANTAMATDRDGMEFSIMTYRSYVGGPADGYTNEQWGYAQSLMMYDIAALQVMYGADFTTNATNSVYAFSSTTGQMFINGVGQGAPGGNRVFLTIWDGGGTDTYDFSNYTTNQAIDLTPGGWSLMSSVQQAYLGDGNYARGNVYNALQSNGDVRSLIENAIGGSGNDTITGNDANNVLTGNGGADTLYGGNGSDTLNGGDGDDTFYGGSAADIMNGGNGNDTFYFDSADTVSGGASNDTVYVTAGDGIGFSWAAWSIETVYWTTNANVYTLATGASSYVISANDTAVTEWWSQIQRTYNLSWQIQQETGTEDAGNSWVSSYSSGILATRTLTDGGAAEWWSTTAYTYGASGAVTRVFQTADTGNTYDYAYSNGVLTTQTISDLAHQSWWATTVYGYDSAGATIRAVQTDDNGDVYDFYYTNGVLSSEIITDTSDQRWWETTTYTFNQNGTMARSVQVDDNGDTYDVAMLDGVVTSNSIVDTSDQRWWSTAVYDFNSSGAVTKIVQIADNGDSYTFTYGNPGNVISTQFIVDLSQAQWWATTQFYFNNSGVMTESIQVGDNGVSYDSVYQNSTITSQTVADLNNIHSWTSYVNSYDALGVITLQAGLYDNGTHWQTTFLNGQPTGTTYF